jgi:transposase
MSRHLTIRPWLSDVELVAWMQEAKSRPEYQRRLSIWLAYLERWPAYRIARALGVSEPAIWKWVGQYNRDGPGGLQRQGRGGRRWAFLSLEEEQALLATALEQAQKGGVLTAKQLLPKLQKAVGQEVTLGYVYGLLHRHGWRKLSPRPAHVKGDPQRREAFKKGLRRSSPKR